MSLQQFEQLLTNLMSPDNNIRGQAEKLFSQGKQDQPDEIVQALLQVGRISRDESLRLFGIILLRRALVGTSPDKILWDKISPATQNLVKQELLKGLELEENPSVRSQLCEATSDIGSDILGEDKGAWNELLDWLLRMATSGSWYHRHSSLNIFSNLCSYFVDAFNDKFQVFKNILSSGLIDPNIKVRLAALNASTNFIHTFTQQPARSELQKLLPSMLEVLATCLNLKDMDSAQDALKLFIDLSELDPGFIKPHSGMIIDAMMKIAPVKELDDSTRQLAAEFLVTFAENKPGHCRSMTGFVPNLLNILLHFMLEIDDISLSAWNELDEDDGSLEILNSVVAQEHLDRVCVALNGESIYSEIFKPILQLISNKQDWKCRHVALMALAMIGEGCYDFILPALEQVLNLILPLFDDEHPRVRWAAVNAIGQMSSDFGPKLQKRYHAQIIPKLIKLLDDVQNPKVQEHTAAAIFNFCEKFDSDTIVNYLDGLLGKLISLMPVSNRLVQEQILIAVGSIAECAGKHFINYYDKFVPILKNILNTATQKEHRVLRGKAMECISLIGIAVGKDKFMADAREVMHLLSIIQDSPLDADDPQREYIAQAWTRISTCLGEDFVPYLKFVMPPLLKSADMPAGVRIQETDIPKEEQEPGWEYIDIGEAKLAVHTSALDEKASAVNSIYCYASEMKEGFFPYVEECSKLLVPLQSYYYHDGVRMSALSTMPLLLASTKQYLQKNNSSDSKMLIDLFTFIYPPLIEAIKTEVDQEVLVVGIESLHECLDVMGDNCLPPKDLKDLLSLVKLLIIGTQSRRSKLLRSDPEDDNDESFIIRDELAKEEDICNEIAEVIGKLVKHHPNHFLPAFQDLFPLVKEMIQRESHPSERQLATCIFDDIVEYTHEQSWPLFQLFVPFMFEYALDPHPGVRQASTYGLGVCAQKGGTNFKPMVIKTLEVLQKLIESPGSRQNDRIAPPTENAISSVGKIIQFQGDVITDRLPELMDKWVSWLPIEIDVVEARVVHQQLCDFIRNMNSLVFGPQGKNLPKVLDIFGQIVDSELVSPETQGVIKQILSDMTKQIPPQQLQVALLSLPVYTQQKLKNLK